MSLGAWSALPEPELAEVPAAKMGLEDTWPMGFQHALLESNPKIDRKVGNCNEGNILLGGLSHLVNGL
mgnify:CR=1 FL=1